MQRPSVDLPQPGLADQAERLALEDVERHAVDGVDASDLPLDDVPPDREVLSRPRREAAPGRWRSCGSDGARAPRAGALLLRQPAGVEWPAPQRGLERRHLDAAVEPKAQRGLKGQPARQADSDGGEPWIDGSRPALPRSGAGSRRAAPTCRDAGGRGTLAVAALLDAPPGVHHEHAVGDVGDDAEVVGDEDDRRPVLALAAA